MGVKSTAISDTRYVNLDIGITSEIEPLVQEDNHKFCLENKDKLLRKFIVYRICNYLIRCVESSKTHGTKILFCSSKSAQLSFLQPYNLFIYNTVIKISKILSLNLYFTTLSFEEFIKTLQSEKGEGREVRVKVGYILNRGTKRPDINKFNKLLKKYDIHKTEGDINTGFKVKLRLFVT